MLKIIPASDPKECCGVFLLEIVDAKSVSGSLHQNPVVPLLHDVFIRISASAASRATRARSLYENFLCKMSVSGSPQQDPVGALVQDRCMRISCARCLCQVLLSKTTGARPLRISCARSLCHDVCIRIL